LQQFFVDLEGQELGYVSKLKKWPNEPLVVLSNICYSRLIWWTSFTDETGTRRSNSHITHGFLSEKWVGVFGAGNI
jgi:hypothetical protein